MEHSKGFTLERKIRAIESAIYEKIHELKVWRTRQGVYVSPAKYADLGEWRKLP